MGENLKKILVELVSYKRVTTRRISEWAHKTNFCQTKIWNPKNCLYQPKARSLAYVPLEGVQWDTLSVCYFFSLKLEMHHSVLRYAILSGTTNKRFLLR